MNVALVWSTRTPSVEKWCYFRKKLSSSTQPLTDSYYSLTYYCTHSLPHFLWKLIVTTLLKKWMNTYMKSFWFYSKLGFYSNLSIIFPRIPFNTQVHDGNLPPLNLKIKDTMGQLKYCTVCAFLRESAYLHVINSL